MIFNRLKAYRWFCLLILSALYIPSGLALEAARAPMASIPAGTYLPFYRKAGEAEGIRKTVQVEAFHLDVHPVTNREFLIFVIQNAGWRRGSVKTVFADKNYLKHWQGELVPGGEQELRAPVTRVSWFAANAYCKWLGKRLPSVDQWEYAANDDGKQNEEIRKRLLEWHSEPNPKVFPPVGSTPKNSYGVADLHGLVWEWTNDFNSLLTGEESREGPGGDGNRFCGSGGMSAKDASDYPTFLRYGFRGSLNAAFTVSNLGFRCSKNKE